MRRGGCGFGKPDRTFPGSGFFMIRIFWDRGKDFFPPIVFSVPGRDDSDRPVCPSRTQNQERMPVPKPNTGGCPGNHREDRMSSGNHRDCLKNINRAFPEIRRKDAKNPANISKNSTSYTKNSANKFKNSTNILQNSTNIFKNSANILQNPANVIEIHPDSYYTSTDGL